MYACKAEYCIQPHCTGPSCRRRNCSSCSKTGSNPVVCHLYSTCVPQVAQTHLQEMTTHNASLTFFMCSLNQCRRNSIQCTYLQKNNNNNVLASACSLFSVLQIVRPTSSASQPTRTTQWCHGGAEFASN